MSTVAEHSVAVLLAKRDELDGRCRKGEAVIVRRSGHEGAGRDRDWPKWRGLLTEYESVCRELADLRTGAAA